MLQKLERDYQLATKSCVEQESMIRCECVDNKERLDAAIDVIKQIMQFVGEWKDENPVNQ